MARCFGLVLALSWVFGVYGAVTHELVPRDAPTNLILLEIMNRQVVIEWDPVDPQSLRGYFRGYLVRTWNHAGSQVYAFPPEITKASVDFFPFSKNFITVAARNEKYVGPPSDAISFDAPQIEPNFPHILNVFSLSDKSVLAQWSKPTQPNGVLLGYKIYCTEINDTFLDEKIKEVSYQINDPEKFQAKLTGLEPGVKYSIGISAFNCAGESDSKTIEIVLDAHIPADPFPSKFIYKINYTVPNKDEVCYITLPNAMPVDEDEETGKEGAEYDDDDYVVYNETKKKSKQTGENKPKVTVEMDYDKRCLVDCMVLWLPDVRNNPGDSFYLKYKIKGEEEYQVTEPETSQDYIILHKFDACRNYEIALVALDGDYSTESGILVTPTKIG